MDCSLIDGVSVFSPVNVVDSELVAEVFGVSQNRVSSVRAMLSLILRYRFSKGQSRCAA
jgi:hypothetical protein